LTIEAARLALKKALSKAAALPTGCSSVKRSGSITRGPSPVPAPLMLDTSSAPREPVALVGARDPTPLPSTGTVDECGTRPKNADPEYTNQLPRPTPGAAISVSGQTVIHTTPAPPIDNKASNCGEKQSRGDREQIPSYEAFLKGLNRGVAKQKRRRDRRRVIPAALLLPSGIQATVEADVVSVLKLLAPPHTLVSLPTQKKKKIIHFNPY
jgi:hypothetical protein